MGRVFNSTSSQIKGDAGDGFTMLFVFHVQCCFVPGCSSIFSQALFCSKPQTARILVYSDGPEAVVYNL